MAGLFVGGMLPFVFSALSMSAVGRAAMAMIEEVRRQFKDIPELKNALVIMRKYDSDMTKATPEDRAIFDKADGYAEYSKCVDISTKASIREMVLPGTFSNCYTCFGWFCWWSRNAWWFIGGCYCNRCFDGYFSVKCRWCLG